jgi:hypothetical protein
MSNFADALMQGMISQMDPNVSMQRDAMTGYLELQQNQVKESQAKTISRLTDQLVELKEKGFDDTSVPVIAINKIIHSLAD